MNDLKRLEKLEKELPNGAFSTFDMAVLVPEVKKLKPCDVYVEIGVDKGKSLMVACLSASEGVRLYGIDVVHQPGIDALFNPRENVMFFHEDSVKVAEYWNKRISLLHIDGDHSYKGCKADIDAWYPYMKDDSVMLFHDCDESSPGVMQAVAEFVNNHKVKSFELFKRTDRNTSMARIIL